MEVVFLGVGEAFDETLPNNSHLILSDSVLLLDCGYSVPKQLWTYNPNQSFLDAIFISHRHADHYFGLPALLVRMGEEKRTKTLTIICQKGLKKIIQELIEYGYQGWSKKLGFSIEYMEVKEGQKINFNELELEFASTRHSVENLAIKISDGKTTFCYSGDGQYTKQTEKLYRNCDLVIHESYLFDKKITGHSSIKDLIEMAKRNNVKCLALTHIKRELRNKELKTIKKEFFKEKIRVIIPNPCETYP